MSATNEQSITTRPSDDHEDDEQDEAESSTSLLSNSTPSNDTRPSLFVWLLTFSAGISGLLFGYDTGVISATLVSIGTSLSDQRLTSLDKSIITSSTSLFALLVLPAASLLADSLGRKRVILFADVLFLVGAVLQACSYSVATMVAGRSIVGAAVGAASFVVPLYIAELAPAAHRGRLVTVNVVFVTLGQVVAYLVGWVFAEHADVETGWRWMVGLGAAPAVIQSVVVFYMPETPRWLVKAGRIGEARVVIARVLGADDSAASVVSVLLRRIQVEIREQDHHQLVSTRDASNGMVTWLDTWHELTQVRKNRRALTIACLLQGLQQLCGFNSLMYFSATVFQMLGFTSPTLASMVVAVTNLVFTIAALIIIDRVGRRRILLYSIPWMAVGLVTSAIAFSRVDFSFDMPLHSSPSDSANLQDHAAAAILLSFIVYVAAYAIGLGNVPWMQSELFSLQVRALGSGVATSTNWAANFVVGLTFLPMMELLSPFYTFGLYAVICIAGWVTICRVYPETSGLGLEEAAALLDRSDWGVGRNL